MSASAASPLEGSRTARLLGFLEHDPENLTLIADAATSALDDGDGETARGLVRRYAEIAQPPPALLNVDGLAAIEGRQFEEAAAIFSGLLEAGAGEPGVRFNLAWCKAMLKDYEGAADLLDDTRVAELPRAAALRVEMLHHLNRLDEALDWGAKVAAVRPDDTVLMSALALAALDATRTEEAGAWAERAGGLPDSEAVLGMVALAGHDVQASLEHFDRALAVRADNARAMLGKGLGLLALGEPQAGAQQLDSGAAAFGDHLGSWLAAGWAYFVQHDYVTARQRFETAMALDDTFAESHGSLAVMDIIDGDLEGAGRRVEVALRLDRECFSAALAKSMLLAAGGNADAAAKVRDIAFNTPIDASGMTIAQAMVGLGTTGSKR